MAIDLNAIRQERAKAVAEMRALNDGVLERGGETTEEHDKFAKMDADIDRLTGIIDREEKLIMREAQLARTELRAHDHATANGDTGAQRGTITAIASANSAAQRLSKPEMEKRVGLALQGWLRAKRPDAQLDPEHLEAAKTLGLDLRAKEIGFPLNRNYNEVKKEYRDLSLTAGSGGYTIPVGFQDALERALLAFGGMRQASSVVRTAMGNDLHWPTTNDTSNKGAILAEATTFSTSVDATFSEVIFKAFKYSSKPMIVSSELLQDSAFDLAAMVGSMLGERIGRIQNDHFSTGAGTTLPKGISVAGSVGKTATATNTFTDVEVIDLYHSVDIAYRPQATWMMHDTILAFIRKMKDSSTGQYLWQPGMSAGVPDRLFGVTYTVNNSLASALTTGQKLLFFGDFSKYKIRDAGDIRLVRLDELFAQTDQVGFVAFMRSDGNLLDAGTKPVKWLALA